MSTFSNCIINVLDDIFHI